MNEKLLLPNEIEQADCIKSPCNRPWGATNESALVRFSTANETDDTRKSTGTRREGSLAVDVEWKHGARSADWGELWRRIFGEVLPPDEGELPGSNVRGVSS